MSIKKVEQIPMILPGRRVSYRDQIRRDINEAIEKRIDKFEFDGDYNYTYLASYAREEAKWIFIRTIYRPAAKKVAETLQKEFGVRKVYPIGERAYKGRYITIKNRKGKDRNHVYAEIDFSQEEEFYNELLTDTRNQYNRYKKNLKS